MHQQFHRFDDFINNNHVWKNILLEYVNAALRAYSTLTETQTC